MEALAQRFDTSVTVALAVAVPGMLAAAIVGYRRRRLDQPVLVDVARILAVVAAAVVLIARALPQRLPAAIDRPGDLVLRVGGAGLGDWRVLLDHPGSLAAALLVGNVVMGVLLALFATLAWPARRLLVVGACVALFIAVEAAQLALGGVAAVDDVLLNAVGVALGQLLALALLRLRPPPTPAP